MPLSLDDLRKTTSSGRKDKRRYIVPQLLENSEDFKLCDDFCRYFAQLANDKRTQKDFSEQYLTERAGGDFKLSRGLITAMLRYYGWEGQTFSDKIGPDEVARLQEIGLTNSSNLRLALYDYVNEAPLNGFAGASAWERAETLDLFGAGLGLEPKQVEELLWLDSEENMRLMLRRRKDGELFRPPTPQEVARQYNRLAIETLLYNSSEVVFGLGQILPAQLIKKIGFFSKEFRIPYDIEYNSAGEIQLRLYGPSEAFGSPTKHGERLARLAFIVLSLANKIGDPEVERVETTETFSGPRTSILDEKPSRNAKKTAPKKTVTSSPLRSALAVVHLRDKLYYFDLLSFAHTLRRFDEPDTPDSESIVAGSNGPRPDHQIRETRAAYTVSERAKSEDEFDSSVEARFYAEFAALEREGQTAGWQLEREPEALAVPEENLIFIPDFALRRGKRRVWLEIIGFWTLAYRARKLEKLEKLKRRGGYDLLLATAEELKADFKDAPFPIIFYKNSLKPTDLLALLNRQYADFEERLAGAHKERDNISERLSAEGLIIEAELYRLLGCYNKSELLGVLQKTGLASEDNKSAIYLEGFGICSVSYLTQTTVKINQIIKEAAGQHLTPEQVGARLIEAGVRVDNGRVEALIERLPGFRINRQSLFEVFVEKL
jgi:predicted nuclease of restriction endonuclease-like RecB superfamily